MNWLAALAMLGSAIGAGGKHSQPPRRQVAITIDDLPYVGSHRDFRQVFSNTQRLLKPIRAGKVPVVGFVIGQGSQSFSPEQRRSIFKLWLDAGGELGNHTWTHPDLNVMPLDQYEAEILRNDADIHRLLDPIKLRYFRAPYLHEGSDQKTNRKLHDFLADHGYTDAPVTFDDDDYLFASAYNHVLDAHDTGKAKQIEDAYIPYMRSIVEFFEKRSNQVFGRECSQILLIHANRLNAKMMPALLKMFRDRNYTFVTLERALSDEAYLTPDGYSGTNGISWIHRWGLSKGMPIVWEPDSPPWVSKLVSP